MTERKKLRLSEYDYGQAGAYFVTVCTKNKNCILGLVVGADDHIGPYVKLSRAGMIVDKYLQTIPGIDRYVVMPNHIHGIFIVQNEEAEKGLKDLSIVIGQYKMSVTKKIRIMEPEKQIWQRSFHDHVIRNQKSYEKIWTYIENNPVKWEEDCFYCENSKNESVREGQ